MRQVLRVSKALTDGASLEFGYSDNCDFGRLTGSFTLNSATSVAFAAADTAVEDLYFEIQYRATLTAGTGSLTIFGTTVPSHLYSKSFTALCHYAGAAWEVDLVPDFEATAVVTGANLVNDAVGLAQIAAQSRGDVITFDSSGDPTKLTVGTANQLFKSDGSDPSWFTAGGDLTFSGTDFTIGNTKVTVAKMQDVAANSLLVRDANSSGSLSAIAFTTTQILINNGTGFTAAALSQDATMDNTGAVTLATTAYTNRLNANTSQVATGANTTETTLGTYTMPANTVTSDGHALIIKASGTTGANTHDKTLTFYIGATTVTNGTTSAPNNLNWEMEAVIFRTGPTSQKGYVKWTFDGVADDVDTISDSAEVFASTITYKITGTNGSDSANDIVKETWVVNRF